MQVFKKIDLEDYIKRSNIKSVLNRKRLNTGLFSEKANFNSSNDFHSDYFYDLYMRYKELVDFYGEPVILMKSHSKDRNRVLSDTRNLHLERGSFQHIRRTYPIEANKNNSDKSYLNITNNPEFLDDSKMLKYKLKSIVSHQNSNQTDTKIGNVINSSITFYFSMLDLFEKNVGVDIESILIYYDSVLYKVNALNIESYFNTDIFYISLQCQKNIPVVS